MGRGQHALCLLCLCDHAATIAALPRSFARAYECNYFGFQKPRMKSGERKGDRVEGYVLTNEHTLSVWAQFGRLLRSTPSVFSQLLALSTVPFSTTLLLKQQDTPFRFQKTRPPPLRRALLLGNAFCSDSQARFSFMDRLLVSIFCFGKWAFQLLFFLLSFVFFFFFFFFVSVFLVFRSSYVFLFFLFDK